MKLYLGPAGLGPVKDAIDNLEEYKKQGLSACEIAFTYGVYINDKKDAELIGKKAKELGIKLSIHAPYWINLNSAEKLKIKTSKERILKCCEIGEILGADVVVFHAGFYGKSSKEDTYNIIKNEILDLENTIHKNKWKIKIAPETMGKVNVFGSIEEISSLVKDTGCSFCIDFAHILARYKNIDYDKIKGLFKEKTWHCHFSGIEYSDKGEKKHIKTQINRIKELIKNLPKDKEITIINESPDMIEDSIETLKLSKNL
jgi:deoxyribonuclease IV